MVSLSDTAGFQWDAANAAKNLLKHGVQQSEIEQVFVNEPLLLLDDTKHSVGEDRFHALGRTGEDRLLHVSFTLREGGKLVRVISARPMNRKERLLYGEET